MDAVQFPESPAFTRCLEEAGLALARRELAFDNKMDLLLASYRKAIGRDSIRPDPSPPENDVKNRLPPQTRFRRISINKTHRRSSIPIRARSKKPTTDKHHFPSRGTAVGKK